MTFGSFSIHMLGTPRLFHDWRESSQGPDPTSDVQLGNTMSLDQGGWIEELLAGKELVE